MNETMAREFFAAVCKDHDIYGWTPEFHDGTDGLCLRKRKLIILGMKSANLRSLILHEIAHINTASGHGELWRAAFVALCHQHGEEPSKDAAYSFGTGEAHGSQ